MNRAISPSGDIDEYSAAEPTQLDLAKYRTGDLSEQITELISVPTAFRKVATSTLLVVVLSSVTCYLIHLYSDMSLLPLLAVCAYALPLGVVFGLLLSLMRIVSTALQNVESILSIVLEITDHVAGDYCRLHAGEVRLPPGGELINRVYDSIVLPVLERSVAKAFGVLSSPLLWCYHCTIGSAIRVVVRRVNRATMTADDLKQVVTDASSSMSAIANYSAAIQSYLSTAAEVVASIGRKIRFYAMLPLYIFFFVSLVVATTPILVTLYIASG